MRPGSVTIRPAVLDDAAAIARVHVDSWRTTYAGLLPAAVLSGLSYERREQGWREALADDERRAHNNVYVADDGAGPLIGFASGGPERDGDPLYPGELYAIYLLAAEQGKGIGRQLVREVTRALLARRLNSMLVWVLESNPSRTFYEKLGGQYVKERAITIGSTTPTEVAYGWLDIRSLA
jgi:GNAT superfamily N-acetyltransferase